MEQFTNQQLLWMLAGAAIWVLPWKGMALWKAARNGSRVWFVVLLLINTLAILEIIYIFFLDKEKTEQVDHI